MIPRGVLVFSVFGLMLSATVRAADPAKVDYGQRHEAFAPAVGITSEKRRPEANSAVQDRRVTPSVSTPASGVTGLRGAPINVGETREKLLIAPTSNRPEVTAPRVLSPQNHREFQAQPGTAHRKPQMVARYQEAMTSANATQQTRTAALEAGTTARVNRFVFRRNVAAPPDATDAVPAGQRPPVARPASRAQP